MQPDERDIKEMPTLELNPEVTKGTYDFFSGLFGGGGGEGGLLDTLQTIWTVYSVVAFIVSGLLIYGIIYSYIRLNEFGEYKAKKILEAEEKWRMLHAPDKGNRRWREVEVHLESNNPNDWKLAIIEADVLLEKMLDEAGFAGATIADRLRSASSRSFGTLEDAWQAHRVRNHIAHGGADFVLTQKMAQATISQYRRVFEEFQYI